MDFHSMFSRVRAPMHDDGDNSHNYLIHGHNLNSMGGHGWVMSGHSSCMCGHG